MCSSLLCLSQPEVGFVCWVSCQVWWTLFPGAGCICVHFNSISSIITAHVWTLLPNQSPSVLLHPNTSEMVAISWKPTLPTYCQWLLHQMPPRRVGCSPDRSDMSKNLVPIRKAPSHQSLRTSSGLQSPPISVQSASNLVEGCLVLVRTDNSTVVSYLNHQGGTHSTSLCQLTWKFLSWCIPLLISLQAIHLAGNKNVIADALSKGRSVPTEWTFHRPTIDWMNISGYAFPPNILTDKSFNKDRERKMQNHPHCSSVATPGLVHQTYQPPHRQSYISPETTRPPFPTHVRAVPPRPRESSSVNLDAIKLTLRQAGLSEDAATLAAKSRRPSTRRTYDNRLQPYIKWCTDETVHSHSASLTDIGDFFLHLFHSGLQISTMRGYRSVITIIHGGFEDGSNLSNNSAFSHLIKGMFIERPPLTYPHLGLGLGSSQTGQKVHLNQLGLLPSTTSFLHCLP